MGQLVNVIKKCNDSPNWLCKPISEYDPITGINKLNDSMVLNFENNQKV